jgi:hypothetical protein
VFKLLRSLLAVCFQLQEQEDINEQEL